MKSELIQTNQEFKHDIFVKGNLVIGKDGSGTVVLLVVEESFLTEKAEEGQFKGVVIYSSNINGTSAIGYLGKKWEKNDFTLFTGKIELTQ